MQFSVPGSPTSLTRLYQVAYFTFTLFPVFLIKSNIICNLNISLVANSIHVPLFLRAVSL